MGYDVFISYSNRDKRIADAACARLEQAGHRCWIAPRDIVPGQEWGEAIIDGITAARVFVLIFSGHANGSSQVRREVERAAGHGLPIIPFRIENVAPARSLEFFIMNQHWLDALTKPMERHLNHLADVVGRLLGQDAPIRPAVPPASGRRGVARWRAGGVAAALALAVAGGWLYFPRNLATEPPPAPVPAPAPPPTETAAPEPQPLVSLLDFASIPIETEPGGQIEAAARLLQAAIPVEIAAISPSSARLLFLDSYSIEAFRDSALDRTNLLALVVQGSVPTYIELRFLEPVAEVHLFRPRVDPRNIADRTLTFPAQEIQALDRHGRVVDRAPPQPMWRSDGLAIDPEPAREIVLRARGSEGIRSVRIRIFGAIRKNNSIPMFVACPVGYPCPPAPPTPFLASLILNAITARRMPPQITPSG